MKYSFLMPYYDRARQLHNTLLSFRHFYSNRCDYEVVIVADGKNAVDRKADRELQKTLFNYKDLNIKCELFKTSVINPCLLFNRAAQLAEGEFFVITNPECLHLSDILSEVDLEFAKSKYVYIVCGCACSKEDKRWYNDFSEFTYKHHMWYQHSKHRNECYHFCTFLSKSIYWLIGGFSEEFANGMGYDDDDFREKVKRSRTPFIVRDDLMVVHQWHTRVLPMKKNQVYYDINKQLYERIHHGK